jgi:hypothetical protein
MMTDKERLLALAGALGWPDGVTGTWGGDLIEAAKGGGEAAWREWADRYCDADGNETTDEITAIWHTLDWAKDRVDAGLDPGPPATWGKRADRSLIADSNPDDVWPDDLEGRIKANATGAYAHMRQADLNREPPPLFADLVYDVTYAIASYRVMEDGTCYKEDHPLHDSEQDRAEQAENRDDLDQSLCDIEAEVALIRETLAKAKRRPILRLVPATPPEKPPPPAA